MTKLGAISFKRRFCELFDKVYVKIMTLLDFWNKDEKFKDWKYSTFSIGLFASVTIYLIVHTFITLAFFFNGHITSEKIIKAVIVGVCWVLNIIAFAYRTRLPRKIVWPLFNSILIALVVSSICVDSVSQNFLTNSPTSLAILLVAISLIGWFYPYYYSIINTVILFGAYTFINLFFYHQEPAKIVFTMVLPVAVGAIFFNWFLDVNSFHQYQVESRNRIMSYTDSLTSCYNRQYLEKHITEAERFLYNGSVLMFDIDHFKLLNDNFGHHIGDLALCNFVQHISMNIRKSDKLIRFGGEEFILFCQDTSYDEALKLAERIRVAVENSDFTPEYTCSIGVSTFRKDERFEAVIQRVDKQLYEAKNTGRNKVC